MKTLLFILTLSLAFSVNAQQKDSLKIKNNISINFLGETLGLTLNYQHYLYNTKNVHLSAEVGTCVTFIAYNNLSIPIVLSAEFGRKHRLCTELAMTNIIDFSPYPKTKAERDSILKIPKSEYQNSTINFWDLYRQPYNYALSANVGYKFITKNGFNIKITGGVFRYQQSPFTKVFVSFMPKIAVGYAF